MGTAIEIQDPLYRESRIREYKSYTEFFAKELYRIHCLIPFAGFKIDLKTGEMEQLPIAVEWQEAINCILKLRDEYMKDKFPEFYEAM